MTFLLALILLALASVAHAQPSPTTLLDCTTHSNCGSGASASSYLTPSFTAHANQLLLMGVGCTDPNDNPPAAPGLSSVHGTWTNVGVTNTNASGIITWIFRTVPSSDQTGQVTITSNSGALDECRWAAVEWSGADVTSSGANAIVQSNGANASTGTSVTATFSSAYGNASNRPWAWAHATNRFFSFTVESGWTAMPATAAADGSMGALSGAWRNDTSDTSYTATFGTNHFLSLAIVEIKAAAAAGNKAGGLVNSTPLKSLINGGLIR